MSLRDRWSAWRTRRPVVATVFVLFPIGLLVLGVGAAGLDWVSGNQMASWWGYVIRGAIGIAFTALALWMAGGVYQARVQASGGSDATPDPDSRQRD